MTYNLGQKCWDKVENLFLSQKNPSPLPIYWPLKSDYSSLWIYWIFKFVSTSQVQVYSLVHWRIAGSTIRNTPQHMVKLKRKEMRNNKSKKTENKFRRLVTIPSISLHSSKKKMWWLPNGNAILWRHWSFCWIYIAIYTDYVLRLKWQRYLISFSNIILMLSR